MVEELINTICDQYNAYVIVVKKVLIASSCLINIKRQKIKVFNLFDLDILSSIPFIVQTHQAAEVRLILNSIVYSR